MIKDEYKLRCERESDIYQHLPTLRAYAEDCDSIVEMGVRSLVSTWAFLAGHPKSLLSIDLFKPITFINHDPYVNLDDAEVMSKAEGINFKFMLGDTLKIKIPETDLLFIDTEHTKEQLNKELNLHSDLARKYIILHDTESAKELWVAVGELLTKGKWKVKEHYQNCNGLTILERV